VLPPLLTLNDLLKLLKRKSNFPILLIMKSIIATGILLSFGSVAVAGPYANIENNTSYKGDTYGGTTTEVHGGYDFGDWKLQGGPVFVNPRGEAGRTEFSAKVSGSIDLDENLELYGEVSAMTEDKSVDFSELEIGTKVGVTYYF
jgi:hypothetical protein